MSKGNGNVRNTSPDVGKHAASGYTLGSQKEDYEPKHDASTHKPKHAAK